MRFPRQGAKKGAANGCSKKTRNPWWDWSIYLDWMSRKRILWCYNVGWYHVAKLIGSYFNPIAVEKLRFVWPSISATIHKFDPTEVFFRKPQLWRTYFAITLVIIIPYKLIYNYIYIIYNYQIYHKWSVAMGALVLGTSVPRCLFRFISKLMAVHRPATSGPVFFRGDWKTHGQWGKTLW